MNWNFHLPVELVFGSGTRHEIKSYIEKIGGTRGVLVCGKSFLRNGTADAFLQAADGALVSVFSDIRPNPTTENVNACAAEMRRVEADFAVALGGGSPMDAAKIIWLLYEVPDIKFDDIALRFMDIRKRVVSFPDLGKKAVMVAIPTTSGTGSEVTPFAVITDNRTGVKYPLTDYALTPDMAIVDPEFVMDLPPSLIVCRSVRAL